MIFKPTVFLARGDEKKLSRELRYTLIKKLYNKDFEIVIEASGKPIVKAEDDIGLSISHRDGVTAFLITPFSPCGIDIEKTKDTFPERVKKAYLTEGESADECFLEWCKREAFVKMTGEGIAGLKKADLSESFCYCDLSNKASALLGEKFTLVTCTPSFFEKKVPPFCKKVDPKTLLC